MYSKVVSSSKLQRHADKLAIPDERQASTGGSRSLRGVLPCWSYAGLPAKLLTSPLHPHQSCLELRS